MILFPNAKINLGLNLVSKRNDGFHNIETIFYPIMLNDIVEFVPSEKTEFTITGIDIKGDLSNNLVLRAFNLLKKDFVLSGIKIHLHKIIPTEAGLGGGSADASFMLKSLNEYFNLNISNNKLLKYAEKLGSDCPFFIENKPSFATSKGEKLEDIELNLKDYYIVIIKPNVQINTADAYKNIKFSEPKINLKEAIKLPINEWKENIFNDFEEYAFSKYPELKEIKTYLYNIGAEFALMTGSGSAIYGIFKTKPKIDKYKDCFVWTEKLK
jgi:4-diphosphocytidyl-2-C-methyl-D-erythritol kinase